MALSIRLPFFTQDVEITEPFAPGDDVELTAPSGRVYVGSVLEADGDMLFAQYVVNWEDRSFVTTGWWHVSSAVKLAQ